MIPILTETITNKAYLSKRPRDVSPDKIDMQSSLKVGSRPCTALEWSRDLK